MDNITWIRFPRKDGSTQFKAFLACPRCNRKRWVWKARYTSITYTGLCSSCRGGITGSQNIGGKNGRWRGGRYTDKRGYVSVKLHKNDLFYCMIDHHGYVYEHRLVYAQHLGRPLTAEEVVHHEDRNKVNNDIGNLRLFHNSVEHTVYHAQQRRLQKACVGE